MVLGATVITNRVIATNCNAVAHRHRTIQAAIARIETNSLSANPIQIHHPDPLIDVRSTGFSSTCSVLIETMRWCPFQIGNDYQKLMSGRLAPQAKKIGSMHAVHCFSLLQTLPQ